MPKTMADEEKIVDLSDIDPNKILSMSLNFELLKYVITSLIHNQQKMDKQLNDLKISLLDQKKYSSNLEMSLIELKMKREEEAEVLEKLLKKKEELNKESEEIEKSLESLNKEKQEEKDKKQIIQIYNMKESKFEENINAFSSDLNIPTDIEKSQENQICEKETNNENSIKNQNLNESKNYSDKDKDKDKENNIIKENNNNNEEENKNKNNQEQNEENNQKQEQKESENNALPQSQPQPQPQPQTQSESQPAKSTNPAIDNAEIEKIKAKNEDLQKQLQLIIGDIKNIKTNLHTFENDFSVFKENINEKIKDKLENEIPSKIDNAFDNKINLIQKNIKKDYDKKYEDITNKTNDLTQKIDDIKNNISKQISLIEEKNNLEFEEIKKNDKINKDYISLTNDKLANMITTITFNNYKNEMIEKNENDRNILNLELTIIKNTINNVKNQLNEHLSDTRDHDNIVNIMKILESLSNHIQRLMEFKKFMEEKEKRKAIVDNTKYVKQDGFNEAINNIHKTIDINKKDFNEIRLDLDAIRNKDLNTKANLRDLKNLEDSIFTKMSTLKETIRENFVEKTMLIKNLKYLEIQTKQLIEESKKKSEKPENWLLAKKPFNGHLCASCEAFIGDLKPTNSKFIAWNKYPAKESIEKLFRINAGFSKILQMANLDNKEKIKSHSLNNSKDERCSSSPEREKKRNTERIKENKSGKSSRGGGERSKYNNSCSQIENGIPGNLPRILSNKKNASTSSMILYDNCNTNRVKTINKKSRSLVNINDNDNENNIKNIDDNDYTNDKELQKPKITKIFRKIGETADKKEDGDKI